jgi:hypothetical protein
MRGNDAFEADMRRPLGFPEAALPAADQDLLERLLDGRLDPASAPPGYRGLAGLLAVATAPATPEELAGEQRTMATFAAAMRSTPLPLVPRRTAVPRKVLTIKAAAAALVAVLSLGGVAAAAGGLLPGQASPVADQALATTGADAAAQGLAAAAGGAYNIAAYCQDVAAGGSADAHGKSQASPPSVSAPSTSVSPPSSGPPTDPGPPASTGPGGHGQGGPPTTAG